MNRRHPVPKRASLTEQQRRTTQEYPALRQAIPQARAISTHQVAPADVWDEEEGQDERDTRATRFPNSARRYPTREQRELVPLQPSMSRASSLTRNHPLLYVGLGMFGTQIGRAHV